MHEKNNNDINSLAQTTPASSECRQLWLANPLWEHSTRELSVPLHRTLSSQMIPVPSPNEALLVNENADLNPSILHATSASSMLHKSSQTVPHPPELKLTSTRPSKLVSRSVPLSRISRLGTIYKGVRERERERYTCTCTCNCHTMARGMYGTLVHQLYQVHIYVQCTLADHSSIFTMATVILSKVVMVTLIDVVFDSGAHHFIQPDGASSKTKTDKTNKNHNMQDNDIW